MLKIKISAIAGGALDLFLDFSSIFRMNSIKNEFHGWFRCGIVFKDSEGLLRPEDFACRRPPAEAAGVAESLGFRQVGLPALQLLGQVFLLSHIHGSADDAFQDSVVENRYTNAPHIAKLTGRSQDAFLKVTAQTFRQHSL